MTWTVSLCVYKSPQLADVGHAFATVSYQDRVYAAAGLSPGQLPGSLLAEALTVIPGPGRIYSEWDSLHNQNLRTRSWPVSEGAAVRVLNKINEDRRKNVSPDIPDGDSTPTDELVATALQAEQDGAEWAGGPNYALLWSNCVTYALSLVQEAGIDVSSFSALVNTPGHLHAMLPAA